MFLQRLKEIIDEHCGGSQKELANKTQIPSSTISHWITKEIKPTYVQIVKICDTFGLSADYVLGRTNEATENVVIEGTQLTADEKQLIELYRQLSIRDKAELIGFAKGLAF